MPDDQTNKPDETPRRILDAAEEIFAERGFKQATVREILDRAAVKNVAAINYHFGDKEGLYLASVKDAIQACASGIPFPSWPEGTSPRLKLRDFVRVMVLRMFQPQRPCALQLMMREMAEPTAAGGEVVREYIQPMARLLESIITELLPHLPRERRLFFGFSVIGQVLFYKTNRAVMVHLIGADQVEQFDPEHIAAHIAAVALGGIDAELAREAKP